MKVAYSRTNNKTGIGIKYGVDAVDIIATKYQIRVRLGGISFYMKVGKGWKKVKGYKLDLSD